MKTKEVKNLALVRVPPGDCWTTQTSIDVLPLIEEVDGKPIASMDRRKSCEVAGYPIFESLLEGMEYVHISSKRTIKDFFLSAFEGRVYSVTTTEVEPEPEPEPQKFSLYGEY